MSFVPPSCASSCGGGSCSCDSAEAEVSRVDASASTITVVPANILRKNVILWNDSTSVAYIKFGGGASSTDFTWRLSSQSGYELPTPIYIGDISAIWEAANGAIQVTELV